MKIQVLKNEDYQDVENLPKKGTERATGYDVIVTSEPSGKHTIMVHIKESIIFSIKQILN
jgi:hypothetical protein